MSESVVDTPVSGDPNQNSIALDSGVVLTGIGGDTDALRKQFEERHDERVDAVEPPAATPKADAAPRQSRGQRRFADLTREREDANRRAEAAETRLKELEAKQGQAAAAAPIVVPVVAAPVAAPVAAKPVVPDVRQKPTEEMVGTKYANYSDFVEDLADWKAEEREVKLRSDLDAQSVARIEADRASRALSSHVQYVFEQGRKAYSDFDAVLAKNPRPIPPMHQQAILSAPNPEQLMYALAQDDAKLIDVIGMSDPIKLGFALAAIAPRQSVAPPASTAPAVRTTNAPAPPQPVGAGTRTAKPSLEELALRGDHEGYKAARAAGQVI